ncbi:MAG: hypothetical protein ABJB12_09675 [Pseudomonadota bacterium]
MSQETQAILLALPAHPALKALSVVVAAETNPMAGAAAWMAIAAPALLVRVLAAGSARAEA